MKLNAYEVLAESFPALMPLLDLNHSVSGMLQAYFTYVAHISADEKLNVTGLKPTFSIVDDNARPDGYRQATIRIDFTRDPTAKPIVTVDKRILWQRNLVIARVMEVNASVRNIARESVTQIQKWASDHKIPWDEVRCDRQVIVRRGGNRMEIELGQKAWLSDEEPENADIPTMRSN